ncbi:MAG: chitobiase/beta-hexosaminidase C-terminal domain-containing protein [Candidatus Moranbacteria bacterium]|nr:chitobiase/beta-hexosaminidase C-terminal domain-containing protein [Candidatus Moranbacteria bacterium]
METCKNRVSGNQKSTDRKRVLFFQWLFFAYLVCFGFWEEALASNYYTDNTCANNGDGTTTSCAASPGAAGAFNSVANMVAKVGGYSPGDVIDGQNKTYYERLAVPSSGSSGGNITFQNFTLDGTLSIDGSYSFNPTNTYSNTSPWSQQSGEIYKKTMTRAPYQLLEDGVKLTPIVTTDLTGALTLARGQYTYNSNFVYYRSSDGNPPASHAIRVSRRDLDGQSGLVYASGKNYLTFSNLTIKNNDANTVPSNAIVIVSGDHITIDGSTITNNATAINANAVTNLTITSSNNISDNIWSGVLIEGNSSNIDISGTYSGNGRQPHYNGTTLAYGMDGDNIGIGGVGGVISGVTIHDAFITNSGAPDGHTNHFGAGVYVGTSNAFTLSDFNILRTRFSGNHNQALGMGTISGGFFGGTFAYNIVYNNSNYDVTGTANAFHIASCAASCSGVSVVNNVFAFNYGNAVLYANNLTAAATMNVKNNSFYNNGRTGTYRGDVWIPSANNNVNESNNSFYRSGTAWDSARVIEKNAVTYDINHIIGSSAGYWQFASGEGVGDMTGDIGFVNPASFDFHLQNDSPAINAGTDVSLVADYDGNPKSGPNFDIGAYEFQDSTVPTTTANVDTGRYNSAQSVVLICDDGAGVGCDKIYYTVNGDTPTTGSSQYSGAIYIASTTILKFFSIDKNSNSETYQTKTYTIDTIAPTGGDFAINGGAAYTRSATVTLNIVCPDDSWAPLQVAYGNNPNPNSDWTACISSKTLTLPADDGDKTVYVRFKDAGNNATSDLTRSINVDQGVPVISESYPNDTVFSVATTSVNLTSTTTEGATCRYSTVSGTDYASMTDFDVTGNDMRDHSVFIGGLNPGTAHDYFIVCQDAAANQSVERHVSFSVSPLENSGVSVESAKITVGRKINAFKDTVRITKNKLKLGQKDSDLANGTVRIYKNNKRISSVDVLSDGSWDKVIKLTNTFSGWLKIRQYDRFGTLLSSDKARIKVDVNAPEFEKPVSKKIMLNGNQRVSFSATDDNSGIDYYKVKLAGARDWRKQYEDFYQIPKGVPGGSYDLYIRAYDNAGNYTEEKTTVTAVRFKKTFSVATVSLDLQNNAEEFQPPSSQ